MTYPSFGSWLLSKEEHNGEEKKRENVSTNQKVKISEVRCLVGTNTPADLSEAFLQKSMCDLLLQSSPSSYITNQPSAVPTQFVVLTPAPDICLVLLWGCSTMNQKAN